MLQGGVLLKKDNFLASSTFSTHAVFKIKVKLTLRRKMREESKKQVFTREIIFGWNSILQAVVLREGTELKTRRRVKLQTICKVHFRASKIAPCLQYCTSEDAIAGIPSSLCSLRFWRAGKDNALSKKKVAMSCQQHRKGNEKRQSLLQSPQSVNSIMERTLLPSCGTKIHQFKDHPWFF